MPFSGLYFDVTVTFTTAHRDAISKELQLLGRGQALVSTSFRDVALPVQVPNYDELTHG